jgi:hypothetical protein
MKYNLKIFLLFVLSFFSLNTYAVVTPNNHTLVAAIINRTGQVIRYYTSDTEVASAILSGASAHLMWEASPNIPVKMEGFISRGYYVPICDEIKSINAGQTINVFTRHQPENSDDYHCRALPIAH